MTATQYEIRAGAYYDSVILMQLQKGLSALPDVVDAGVVMATPANKELLTAAGFDISHINASSDDLLIVVSAESDTAASEAIAQVDQLLKRRRSSGTQTYRPRSLAAAAETVPDASWVLISVPGRYAADVAEEALDLGKHVFLYSDNVSVEDEIRLKTKSANSGLLMMGPDCGTAIVNGVGLGFANRVARGNIGVVAASGTGLQAVTVGVHTLGQGISQAIGTGGRDLKATVGGTTARQALDLLARDPATEVIVLVSKPPDSAVATQLLAAAQATGKPVVVNFIGYASPAERIGNLWFVNSLQGAAEKAVALSTSESDPVSDLPSPSEARYLRALYSGGTLAVELLLAMQSTLSPLFSNIPLSDDQQMADVWQSDGHVVIDLGEDAFTQGRLHPMMDNDLRLRRLRQEAEDPETGLIALDVVLGEGAHLDPASELAPAIAEVKQSRPSLPIAILLVGTDQDPQDLTAQQAQFEEAGAVVVRTSAEMVALINQMLPASASPVATPTDIAAFGDSLSAINVGLESFADSIVSQGGAAVQVDWRPPAGGNEKLMALLAKMK